MNPKNPAEPPIILDKQHVEELRALAASAIDQMPDAAGRLLQEIERATVVPSDQLPENVVTIGSTVTFRDDTRDALQTVTLVLPAEADISQRRISVLTPIGAALIGLAEGASIGWETRLGEQRRLTVCSISQS